MCQANRSLQLPKIVVRHWCRLPPTVTDPWAFLTSVLKLKQAKRRALFSFSRAWICVFIQSQSTNNFSADPSGGRELEFGGFIFFFPMNLIGVSLLLATIDAGNTCKAVIVDQKKGVAGLGCKFEKVPPCSVCCWYSLYQIKCLAARDHINREE